MRERAQGDPRGHFAHPRRVAERGLNLCGWRSGKTVQAGFSLIEMLIALVFTGILMAGLSTVYRSSISLARSEGDKLSSARRNRLAAEIVLDDLDSAGQTLANIIFHPNDVSSSVPLFAIYPDGRTTLATNEQRDMIQFFFEDALPFEARLHSTVAGGGTVVLPAQLRSSSQAIAGGDTVNKISVSNLDPIELNFKNADFMTAFKDAVNKYAGTLSPVTLILKDQWRVIVTTGATAKGTTTCTVTQASDQDRATGSFNLSSPFGQPNYTPWVSANDYGATTTVTGSNSVSTVVPNDGAPITIVRPRLLVRYTIEDVGLDPSDGTKMVPCLVKNVWAYDALVADSNAVPTKTLLAEDVVGLKVLVSYDGGTTWLGGTSADTNDTVASRATAWGLLKGKIDTAIGKFEDVNRAKSTVDSSWFRYFPTLIRLDLTTRTAVARNVSAAGVPTFAKNTKVIVAMPRYFGMPLTSTQ